MIAAIRRWWVRSWFHFTHCGEVENGSMMWTPYGRRKATYYSCVCAEAGFNWTDFSFAHAAEDFTSVSGPATDEDQHPGKKEPEST